MSVYQRGDIVRVDLDPVSGSEMQGQRRPCLVLTEKSFNRLGSTLVAPISQGGDYARFHGFSVSLMGTGTQGVVLLNSLRMLDLRARASRKVESAPDDLVKEVLARCQALIEFDDF